MRQRRSPKCPVCPDTAGDTAPFYSPYSQALFLFVSMWVCGLWDAATRLLQRGKVVSVSAVLSSGANCSTIACSFYWPGHDRLAAISQISRFTTRISGTKRREWLQLLCKNKFSFTCSLHSALADRYYRWRLKRGGAYLAFVRPNCNDGQ